jgi:hypothetical protein
MFHTTVLWVHSRSKRVCQLARNFTDPKKIHSEFLSLFSVIDRGPTSATDVNFPYLAFRNDAAQLDGSPSYSVQGPHFIWKLRENGELYIFYRTVCEYSRLLGFLMALADQKGSESLQLAHRYSVWMLSREMPTHHPPKPEFIPSRRVLGAQKYSG